MIEIALNFGNEYSCRYLIYIDIVEIDHRKTVITEKKSISKSKFLNESSPTLLADGCMSPSPDTGIKPNFKRAEAKKIIKSTQ